MFSNFRQSKMIDTNDLQAFLGKIEGGAVAVDLLKIGENNHQQYGNAGKYKLFLIIVSASGGRWMSC